MKGFLLLPLSRAASQPRRRRRPREHNSAHTKARRDEEKTEKNLGNKKICVSQRESTSMTSFLSLSSNFSTMSANPLERVAQQLEDLLPNLSSHASGAETPAPFHDASAPATPGRKRTRLACLTSGGDSAGMNAAVRAVVKMTIAEGVLALWGLTSW
jgi:hypothetical protein